MQNQHLVTQTQRAAPAGACLCAALGNPEASHDLIEAQQGTLLLGDIPQSLRSWAKVVSVIQLQQYSSIELAQGRARSTLLNTADGFCWKDGETVTAGLLQGADDSYPTWRNSWVGAMNPELPTTGSRMTPAISSLLSAKICFTLSMSLYFAHSVVAAHTACNVSGALSMLHLLCWACCACRPAFRIKPHSQCSLPVKWCYASVCPNIGIHAVNPVLDSIR